MKASIASSITSQSIEPKFEMKTYIRSELITALNWYAANSDHKKSREWFMKWAKKSGFKGTLPYLKDFDFRNLGFVARIVERGFPSDSYIENHLNSGLKRLTRLSEENALVARAEEAKQQVKKPVVNVSAVLSALDVAVDQYKTTGKGTISAGDFKVAERKEMSNKIMEMIVEATDKNNVEYYGGKTAANAFVAWCKTLLFSVAASNVRTTRKPRVAKAKDPEKAVKRFEHMPMLGKVKSQKPVALIGAKEAYLYDSEKRKLIHLVSDDKLSINGASIVGFNPEKSSKKTIRNPEDFLVAVASISKTEIAKLFTQTKTTAQKILGARLRGGEKVIILKVY